MKCKMRCGDKSLSLWGLICLLLTCLILLSIARWNLFRWCRPHCWDPCLLSALNRVHSTPKHCINCSSIGWQFSSNERDARSRHCLWCRLNFGALLSLHNVLAVCVCGWRVLFHNHIHASKWWICDDSNGIRFDCVEYQRPIYLSSRNFTMSSRNYIQMTCAFMQK